MSIHPVSLVHLTDGLAVHVLCQYGPEIWKGMPTNLPLQRLLGFYTKLSPQPLLLSLVFWSGTQSPLAPQILSPAGLKNLFASPPSRRLDRVDHRRPLIVSESAVWSGAACVLHAVDANFCYIFSPQCQRLSFKWEIRFTSL